MIDQEMTRKYTITIANGACLSDAIDFAHYKRMLIIMPSGWTAADIAFKVSDSKDGTYNQLKKASDASLIKLDGVAADDVLGLTGDAMEAIEAAPWVKLHSIDSGDETDENQGADRIFTIIVMR